MLESRAPPAHVGPLGLEVLKETLVTLALLDLLDLLVVLEMMEFVLKESKERVDSLENEDPKVLRAAVAHQVLQVLVLKERREIKEQQVTQDHLVSLGILDKEAGGVGMDHQALLGRKARWGAQGCLDLLV